MTIYVKTIRYVLLAMLFAFISFNLWAKTTNRAANVPDGTLAKPYTVSDCTSFSSCPAGVYRFTPADDVKKIQATLDAVHASFLQSDKALATYSVEAEWSNHRFALLFEPGTYNVRVKLNYYTQLLGMGITPDLVKLTDIMVDNLCFSGDIKSCITLGALNNFWRGVENVTFNPAKCSIATLGNKCVIWNVSQAAPMRSVIINGDLMLNAAGCFDFQGQCGPPESGAERECSGEYDKSFTCGAGYASGGYMANVHVNGVIHSIAQQQWFTRDSSFTRWDDGVWNIVFLNTTGKLPAESTAKGQVNLVDKENWPVYPNTAVTRDPSLIIQEKPYLVYGKEKYSVVVPGKTTRTYPLDNLVVMGKNNHDAAKINSELAGANKSGLVIEPGLYQLSAPINVPTGKFVLGLGLPELQCTAGNSCFNVSGNSAIVAGIMLSAGYKKSNTLLLVDAKLDNAQSSNNGTALIDIFCRIGEANKVRQGTGPTADNCIIIDADYVMGDNLWLWRADHDRASTKSNNPAENFVTWSQDVSQHGLVVNGNNVTMMGLFSEHHQASNVLWNGDKGKTYFYQSELAYDAPADWQCADFFDNLKGGCASYMLGKNVKQHHAYGLGVYTFFQNDVMVPSAIAAPLNNTILLEHLIGRYLNAKPSIVSKSGFACIVKGYSATEQTCSGPSATDGNGSTNPNDPAKLPALGKWSSENIDPTLTWEKSLTVSPSTVEQNKTGSTIVNLSWKPAILTNAPKNDSIQYSIEFDSKPAVCDGITDKGCSLSLAKNLTAKVYEIKVTAKDRAGKVKNNPSQSATFTVSAEAQKPELNWPGTLSTAVNNKAVTISWEAAEVKNTNQKPVYTVMFDGKSICSKILTLNCSTDHLADGKYNVKVISELPGLVPVGSHEPKTASFEIKSNDNTTLSIIDACRAGRTNRVIITLSNADINKPVVIFFDDGSSINAGSPLKSGKVLVNVSGEKTSLSAAFLSSTMRSNSFPIRAAASADCIYK